MARQPFDLVLFGATGFTGRQLAAYLAAHAPTGTRLAVAGRDRDRLQALQDQVGAKAAIVADSSDQAAIDAMVEQARVVVSTAGPFHRYSDGVAAACAHRGVDYADITGEAFWVRTLIDRFHDTARASGARLVPGCGFDSVPSDLGTLRTVHELRQRFGQPTRQVSASFKLRAGLNGGTFATMLDLADGRASSAAGDVLLLNPADRASAAERQRSADFSGVRFDADRDCWLCPFFMAPINTRVVRRSNALAAIAGEPYGPEFSYQETLETRQRLRARLLATGWPALERLLTTAIGRALARKVGPRPGQGPSAATMAGGFMRVRLLGEADDGRKLLVALSASGDPSNLLTVQSLGEAALLLLGPRDQLPATVDRGGVLTPARAFGLRLLERLERVGWQVTVTELS